MERKGIGAGIWLYVLLIVAVLGGFYLMQRNASRLDIMSYNEFENAIENHYINSAEIVQNRQTPTGKLVLTLTNGTQRAVYVTDVNTAQELLVENKITVHVQDVIQENTFMTSVLPILIVSVLMLVFMFFLMGRANGGGGANAKMMNFGKSRARLYAASDNQVTFAKVAGLEEEKEELAEVVDFLSNPIKYTSIGARIPTGILLVGPPGTGKTLIAKAVAGEAGVPFFSISGSDFVEMFVGVGASRVRDLFEEAKKSSPCIVFIDEIDAVGRRRGTGMGGGHDEREQTLNQLLVEMDGFTANTAIIVMAATNRVDILDPALLRPGRFDRKVVVGRPDVKGRLEILQVHASAKPLGDDVNLQKIAQTTSGFTGADLENLLNEAAIHAARRNSKYIAQGDIESAFVKVGIGAEKRSKVISDKEKRITAFHEAGHAILFHVLPDVGPVHTISIIPTGVGAAGYTMPLPEQDEMFNTRGKMLQSITVALGGRVAEELVFDDITTGASQDIKQASEQARAMVTRYGMSDRVGLITYGADDDEVFIGRDLAHTRTYSEGVASMIDEEVKRIMDDCYARAHQLIEENRSVLDACAALLLEREKISGEEFETLFHPDLLTGDFSGDLMNPAKNDTVL